MLLVQALDGEVVSVDRIVRSAVISKECGAACAVVLNNTDVAGPELLASNPQARAFAARAAAETATEGGI